MLAYVCSTATSETQKQHERKQQRLQSGAPTADALDAARHSSEYHDGGGKGPLTGHDAIPGDDHESDVVGDPLNGDGSACDAPPNRHAGAAG